jgi:hypothetical protein
MRVRGAVPKEARKAMVVVVVVVVVIKVPSTTAMCALERSQTPKIRRV